MHVLKLNLSFNFGDEVYLKTDRFQFKRIITGIMLKPKDILYQLSCIEDEDQMFHYDFELTIEPDESIDINEL
jgi:hypothetical protein